MWLANATTTNERRDTNESLLSWPDCGKLREQTVELRRRIHIEQNRKNTGMNSSITTAIFQIVKC